MKYLILESYCFGDTQTDILHYFTSFPHHFSCESLFTSEVVNALIIITKLVNKRQNLNNHSSNTTYFVEQQNLKSPQKSKPSIKPKIAEPLRFLLYTN